MNADQPRIFGCHINNAKFWYQAKIRPTCFSGCKVSLGGLRYERDDEKRAHWLSVSPILFLLFSPWHTLPRSFPRACSGGEFPAASGDPSLLRLRPRKPTAVPAKWMLRPCCKAWPRMGMVMDTKGELARRCKRDTLLVCHMDPSVGCLFFWRKKAFQSIMYRLESITRWKGRGIACSFQSSKLRDHPRSSSLSRSFYLSWKVSVASFSSSW